MFNVIIYFNVIIFFKFRNFISQKIHCAENVFRKIVFTIFIYSSVWRSTTPARSRGARTCACSPPRATAVPAPQVGMGSFFSAFVLNEKNRCFKRKKQNLKKTAKKTVFFVFFVFFSIFFSNNCITSYLYRLFYSR